MSEFGLTEDDVPVLCVTAPPGVGKSALMAKLAKSLKEVSDVITEFLDMDSY